MAQIREQVRLNLPHIDGPLPGPRARAIIERDRRVVSPSYTRPYPMVAASGAGLVVEDAGHETAYEFL